MQYVKKYKFIVLVILILFVLGGSYFKKDDSEGEIVQALEIEDVNFDVIEEKDVILVDVKGAVKNPGVFELNEGSRVIDVINFSGGLLESADVSNINLSKKVYDEMVIIIGSKEEKDSNIFVDIKGAVKNPGVYQLKEGSRIIDVINKSGGLLETADTSNINLSRKICDEMAIYINFKEEEKVEVENNCPIIDDKNEDTKEEIRNDASIESENNESNLNKDEVIDKVDEKISLNKATKEQLMALPGIGESKALAIIEYRNNKLFESIDEIMNIKGIGNSIYEKIKEFITL